MKYKEEYQRYLNTPENQLSSDDFLPQDIYLDNIDRSPFRHLFYEEFVEAVQTNKTFARKWTNAKWKYDELDQ